VIVKLMMLAKEGLNVCDGLNDSGSGASKEKREIGCSSVECGIGFNSEGIGVCVSVCLPLVWP
jgi:hypothetical protein